MTTRVPEFYIRNTEVVQLAIRACESGLPSCIGQLKNGQLIYLTVTESVNAANHSFVIYDKY